MPKYLETFFLFQHLPLELRLQILRLLLQPRLVEVHWSHQHRRFVSITPVPAIFQINRELRDELLKLYPPSFSFRQYTTDIYFNTRLDTVFFDFTLSKRALVLSYFKGTISHVDVDKIPSGAWRLFALFSKVEMEQRLGALLRLTPVGDQKFRDRQAGYRQSLIFSGGPQDPSIFEDIQNYIDSSKDGRQRPVTEIGWTEGGMNPWRHKLCFLREYEALVGLGK